MAPRAALLVLLWFVSACEGEISGSLPADPDGGGARSDGGGGGGGGDGGGGGGDGGGGVSPDAEACPAPSEHSGEATYFDTTGSGNCSFDPTPDNLLLAAMNNVDYAGSDACGACALVDGPNGSVTVRVVDRCPGCSQGDIDLSRQAFAMIAPLSAGRVDIAWRYVACDVSGPILYHLQGSTWSSFQVRNHRYGVARLEARRAGASYSELSRALHNYFDGSGLGSGPIDLRLTDFAGHVIEDLGLTADGGEVSGAAQFPVCEGP